MATDGVEIVDGDLAHDTYWGIIDLYDSQVEPSKILKEFPLEIIDYYDDFENEIYVTSAGLAYWEIGLMSKKYLKTIQEVIEKGECVKVWTEEADKKEGKKRKSVLERFWKKINKKNTKKRKPRKHRKVENLHFQEDEVLIYRLKNGKYCAIICCEINQHRGNCNYMFVPTTYSDEKKPSIRDVQEQEILGRQIISGLNKEITKQQQIGIEKIWNYIGGRNNFLFGIAKIGISHKDLSNLKDQIESIGHLKIFGSFKETGSIGFATNFDTFEEIYKDIEGHMKIFGYQKYPLKILTEK